MPSRPTEDLQGYRGLESLVIRDLIVGARDATHDRQREAGRAHVASRARQAISVQLAADLHAIRSKNSTTGAEANRHYRAEPVLYSPPGKRPNAHAFPSAVPAAANLGIPAGGELIKALVRGILPAISAEAAEPLGSVAGKVGR